ncbi:MAG: isopeptide-forming domain-containing fimbrial protein [Oscillospiraceae bacterium]|nr:isopeptide-forming domain-containing fimbrial protein [Oscillospiraceae bacterium]
MKRKIISVLLALFMAISIAAPLMTIQASAANFTADPKPITIYGSDTVNIVGETFEVYKIFDLQSWDILDPKTSIDDERFAYRITDDFQGFDGQDTYNFLVGLYGYGKIPADLDSTDILLKDVLEYFRGDTPYADIASDEALEANDDFWAVPLTKALIEYIERNSSIQPFDTFVITKNNGEEFSLDDLGYYLIRSQGYNPDGDSENKLDGVTAIAALRTNEVAVEIHCKADTPTIDKDVWYEKGESWNGYTDVNIDDTVWFKLTSKVPNMRGYKYYYMTMYDALSSGLTYDLNSYKVYIAPASDGLTTADLADIPTTNAKDVTTHVAVTQPTEKYNLVFDFDDIKDWYDQADGTDTNGKVNYVGWDIIVIYSATLNEDAVITKDIDDGELGNPNSAYLEYSNNPYDTGDGTTGNRGSHGRTKEKKVTVFTFEINVKKYFIDANDKELTNLKEGAVFQLYKADDDFEYNFINNKQDASSIEVDGTVVYFTDLHDGQYMHTNDKANGTTDLRSPASGLIDLIGLEEGAYYLVEVDAPVGYNILEAPILINISYETDNGSKASNWKVTKLTKTYETYGEDYTYGEIEKVTLTPPTDYIKIENRSGIKFPETGGIGRTIFYIVGTLLTLGTGFVLIIRSKLSKKEKNQAN